MRLGISGAAIPHGLPYADAITQAADEADFWPCFAYAIAWRETIRGEKAGLWPNALTVVADDNGSGLCQPTPAAWWPAAMNAAWAACDWRDGVQNTAFAIKWFLQPAIDYWWGSMGLTGDALVKVVADEYNAGRSAVIEARAQGNADLASTGKNYGSDVVAIMHQLVVGLEPT